MSETEGLIIVAQHQSLMTKQDQSEVIKNGTNPKFRLCNEFNESIDHITRFLSFNKILRNQKCLISKTVFER